MFEGDEFADEGFAVGTGPLAGVAEGDVADFADGGFGLGGVGGEADVGGAAGVGHVADIAFGEFGRGGGDDLGVEGLEGECCQSGQREEEWSRTHGGRISCE